MHLSFPRRLLVSVVLIASFFALPASADEPKMIDKQLSPDCQKMALEYPVHDQPPNVEIPHQFMLLLVFKKNQGSRYFGRATPAQYGCLIDAPDADGARAGQAPAAGKTLLRIENCPNDCVYPYGVRPATVNGTDPLNANPEIKTNMWGILSAVDSAPQDGGPDRRIEVWQIPVTDACHARKLYAHYTKSYQSLLRRALRAHHMLGEILVGYTVPGNGDAKSTPCR